MTKQEQIEEMAKIIMQVKPCEALTISECIKRKCKYPHYSGVTCIAEHQAETLYNAGYRKLKSVEDVFAAKIVNITNQTDDIQSRIDMIKQLASECEIEVEQ